MEVSNGSHANDVQVHLEGQAIGKYSVTVLGQKTGPHLCPQVDAELWLPGTILLVAQFFSGHAHTVEASDRCQASKMYKYTAEGVSITCVHSRGGQPQVSSLPSLVHADAETLGVGCQPSSQAPVRVVRGVGVCGSWEGDSGSWYQQM